MRNYVGESQTHKPRGWHIVRILSKQIDKQATTRTKTKSEKEKTKKNTQKEYSKQAKAKTKNKRCEQLKHFSVTGCWSFLRVVQTTLGQSVCNTHMRMHIFIGLLSVMVMRNMRSNTRTPGIPKQSWMNFSPLLDVSAVLFGAFWHFLGPLDANTMRIFHLEVGRNQMFELFEMFCLKQKKIQFLIFKFFSLTIHAPGS